MNIKFKAIYLNKNQGHGNARRISVNNCSNELVALMDADDISCPKRFEIQLNKFFQNPEIDIVGGQITEFIDSETNIIGKRTVLENNLEIYQDIKKRCPMNQVTVMFKKSIYNKAGGYIDWFCEEDYYLWLRLAEVSAIFANVPETLVNVRVGNEMSSRRGGFKYFLSELRLQNYMLKKGIISLSRYLYNVILRFGGQVILPNKIRTKLFILMREKLNFMEIENIPDYNFENCKGYYKFSVAMCVYGGDNPLWFETALKSIILDQSVKPNELVLVVDGPIPKEIQFVINKYKKMCNL